MAHSHSFEYSHSYSHPPPRWPPRSSPAPTGVVSGLKPSTNFPTGASPSTGSITTRAKPGRSVSKGRRRHVRRASSAPLPGYRFPSGVPWTCAWRRAARAKLRLGTWYTSIPGTWGFRNLLPFPVNDVLAIKIIP